MLTDEANDAKLLEHQQATWSYGSRAPLPFLSVKVPAPTATWVGKPVIFVYWGALNVCKEKI